MRNLPQHWQIFNCVVVIASLVFLFVHDFQKLSTMEESFPKSLKEFGYGFDEDGRLRKLDPSTGVTSDQGFEFNVSPDAKYNQKRYEALGEIINEHVYDLLEQEGLKKLPLPKESNSPIDTRSFVFGSSDLSENDKLLILIHGSGVVRAGQWARRLIINDNLSTGTQIPYVRKARELGYAVLVLNTNDNYRTIGEKSCKIKGSGDPLEHFESAWEDYVRTSSAKHVAIVAHSYGGECTAKFAKRNVQEFEKKVFAVGLTDSVHLAPSSGFGYIRKIARNWACSAKPLDTPLPSATGDIERVSAGHTVHEMSSSSCMDSIFKFLRERYESVRDGRSS